MSKDAIKFLRSSSAVIVVLVLAIMAQMPHAQYVMFGRSRAQDWTGKAETILGAIALEIAVLVFAIRGNVRVSWGCAAFSVCVNLAYYYDTPASLWTPTNWLLSAGLPIVIALYSHEVAKEPTECTDEPKQQPAKRTVRSVRSVQTIEASEQIDEQPVHNPVQLTVQAEEQPVQIDLTSLSIEQKKVYAEQAIRTGCNMTQLAKDLKVRRATLYEWKAEISA